jgi:thiol:disulfide interchange protein
LKKLFSILAVCVYLGFAAEAKVGVSYKKAMEDSKRNSKPILIEFYAKWCLPCLEMEKTIFKDPTVIKELNNNFYFVRIDTEKNEEIFCEGETLPTADCIEFWEIEGLPAFAVLDANGGLKHLTIGFFEKNAFLNFLRAIRVK